MQPDLAQTLAPSADRWRAQLQRLGPAVSLAASRGGAVGVQFLVQVVVGALAGPAGLGILALFTSWSCLLGEVLAQGLPARAMRTVAVNFPDGDRQWIRDDLRRSALRILGAAALLAILAALALLVGRNLPGAGNPTEYTQVALAVVAAAPLFALLRLGSDALKGAGAPLEAITLENLVTPGVLLLVCALCWLTGQPLLTTTLLMAGVAGFALAPVGIWASLVRRLARSPGGGAGQGSGAFRDHRDQRALWANSILSIAFLHLPFLVLPWYADPAEIGIYAVAFKLVSIITTLLMLLAAVFGPAFAREAATGDADAVRALLRRTQWISTVIFLPFMSVLLLAAEPLASLFSLADGALLPYLVVLAVGHFVNAATGLSGVLLNMVGEARLELKTLVGSLLVALALAPLVGPLYGAMGLACLFSAALAAKNLASYGMASHFLQTKGTFK